MSHLLHVLGDPVHLAEPYLVHLVWSHVLGQMPLEARLVVLPALGQPVHSERCPCVGKVGLWNVHVKPAHLDAHVKVNPWDEHLKVDLWDVHMQR